AIRAARDAIEQDPRVIIPGRSQGGVVSGNQLLARVATFWAFVPSGRSELAIEGQGLEGATVNVEDAEVQLQPGSRGDARVGDVIASGGAWRRVSIAARTGSTLGLTRLTWRRAGAGAGVTSRVSVSPSQGCG